MLQEGLFGADVAAVPWRVAPEPFAISPAQFQWFQTLGEDLWLFYQAVDRLHLASQQGKVPAWVQEYLTMRIDGAVRELGAGKAFQGQNVRVMRPDVLWTKDGAAITELDSVPGGMGWTACMNKVYEDAGYVPVGAGARMEKNFAAMLRDAAGTGEARWGIIVSEESKDYFPEMQWLGRRLNVMGLEGEVLAPEALRWQDGALRGGSGARLDVLYRFFELFDHRAIAHWDLMVHALKAQAVRMTPPPKSYLEEKLLFALFHHPCLKGFWENALGPEAFERLAKVMPKTWILDPRPLPPQAVVPDLEIAGKPVQRWEDLAVLTQKQRRLVIKPSGYSPLAWGSRGVIIGHDLPQERWAAQLQNALDHFGQCPYVLQQYKEPRRVKTLVLQEHGGGTQHMEGRVRLCPYYFIVGGKPRLSGILATVCPLDKKLIHGMKSAIMAPCAVGEEAA